MTLLARTIGITFSGVRFMHNTKRVVKSAAKILDGKQISQDILTELKQSIDKWTSLGNRAPSLRAVLVGNDPASEIYVKRKMEAAKTVGISSATISLPSTTTQEVLIAKIQELNRDESVDAILVQLPVPEGVDERTVCNAVDADKDVDGFHITNVGKLCLNMETFVPCTPLGVVELIKRAGVETFGKRAVVCGRSKNVGLPMSLILHSDYRNALPGLEATTITCHRNTKPEDLKEFTKTADIIISATGVVGLITADMVKPGACVIDVGLTRVTQPDGKVKLKGDVDYEEVRKVAGYITPVPGGVGPMTVAMLMKNTFQAAKMHATKQKQ